MTTTEFTAIVDEHYEALYRFAYSLSRDSHTAADLTQQAFYVLADKGYQLRERAKAKSWLFTTLHREFLKLRRRSERVAIVEDPEPLMETPDEAEATDSQARHLDGATVVEALGQLDESFRAPLALFYLQQVSYKEIAAILGIPIGTVMSRLSRGKQQLRRLVEAAHDAPHDKVVPFPRDDASSATDSTSSTSSHV